MRNDGGIHKSLKSAHPKCPLHTPNSKKEMIV